MVREETSVTQLRIPRKVEDDISVEALPRRIFANAHTYHINSISVNSDEATYLSADDLRINVWHLECTDQSFSILLTVLSSKVLRHRGGCGMGVVLVHIKALEPHPISHQSDDVWGQYALGILGRTLLLMRKLSYQPLEFAGSNVAVHYSLECISMIIFRFCYGCGVTVVTILQTYWYPTTSLLTYWTL